ncbi:hypothetical protein TNCV_1796141, partial [Trichonephila clavipes]
SENPLRISASVVVIRSGSEITPLQGLRVLCGLIVAGESRKDLANRKDVLRSRACFD